MLNVKRFAKILISKTLICGLAVLLFIQPSRGATFGSCGPDATRGLVQMLGSIEAFFRAQPAHEQDSLCQGLYGLGYYSQLKYQFGFEFWDMRELRIGAAPNRAKWHYSNPNYHCEDTVQIQIDGQNQCFHAWAVNYASWGLMNRLCHEVSSRYSEGSAELMETAYKDIIYLGQGLDESKFWTTIGYSYADNGTQAISEAQDVSKYEFTGSCPLDPTKGELPATFHFHWGPHQFTSAEWN